MEKLIKNSWQEKVHTRTLIDGRFNVAFNINQER
jgi:hypothetical protein